MVRYPCNSIVKFFSGGSKFYKKYKKVVISLKINKKISSVTLALTSTFVLAACGGADDNDTDTTSSSAVTSSMVESSTVAEGELQDGTYKLVEKNFDENGWKTDFTITVTDGMITESNYENLDEDGNKKSEDEGYQEAMSEKSGLGPKEYFPELNDQLVDKQDPSEVEVVTGATHSSDSFKEYAQQLVDAAKEGNTETIEIDN